MIAGSSLLSGVPRTPACPARLQKLTLLLLASVLGLAGPGRTAEADSATSPYLAWTHGPAADPGYFPIAVWLQDPRNAARFKEAGINLYVGLWKGPTDEQLARLKEAGMQVICHQNDLGLTHPDRDVIVGWMHGDEPDNAQSLGQGKGYGPPIPPDRIVADYRWIQERDPTRPILLNLGQGVAWDHWIGRGVRRNHPEDYLEYVQGCDIVSFDIYPVVHDHPDVAGRLEWVPRGVDRLRDWTRGKRVVWNCIEASRISNVDTKPTAAQVRSEVWMSLIHGSRGLIYFVHQFKPRFVEASLLDDAELLRGVTALNLQIQKLAPVLNSPTLEGWVRVSTEPADGQVDVMVKRKEGDLYVFAANMKPDKVQAAFRFEDKVGDGALEVLGEDRVLHVSQHAFADDLEGYGVHLYRIRR